jgi:fibronectin-binding autotransporter adhesin
MAKQHGLTRVFPHGRVLAALATALLGASLSGPALGQTRGTWNVDASGTWSVTSNWLGNAVAGGVSGTANFTNNITADRTVSLDTNRSLGAFVFGDSDTASAASWTVAPVTGGTTITMANGTNSATFTVNALGTGATATISAVLASSTSPSIIKNGVGTLVLTATNNFTNLAITEGTLRVTQDRNLGAVPGSYVADRIVISNGATVQTGTFTWAANRGITIGSGSGIINTSGAGAQTVFNTRFAGVGEIAKVTGVGGVTLANSTGTASNVNWDFAMNNDQRVFFAGSNSLGAGDVIVRSGVRLGSQSTAPTGGQVTNAVTLESGAGLTARSNAGAVTYTNVTLPSTGTLVLNKDDSVTAALTVTSGKELSGDLTINTQQGGANAVGDVTLSGIFSGASGALIKSGTGASGRLILAGANTYAGNTTINTGTLQLGNGGTVGSLSTSSIITGSAGATLAFNRSDTITSGVNFNSAIGGAIGVAQVGAGTVVLSSSSTYTGATSITNGTVEISNNGGLGSVPGSFTADHLQISNSATLRTTAAVNLGANRGITIGTGTATLNVNGGNLQAGRFTGAGNTVAVTGSASLSLLAVTTGTANVNWDFGMNSSQRAFFAGSTALGTGGVRVRDGVRLTSQNVASGTLTNVVTLDSGAGLTARSTGGDLTYTNVIFPSTGTVVFNKDDLATSELAISSSGSLAGNLTVDTSQGGGNAVANVLLNGVFSGAGGLVKAGTGTSGRLVLGGANTYTGNTTISTGTLRLGAGGSIATSGTISVASGAWFDTSLVPSGFSLASAQWLMGSGTVLGDVSSLGTIAPGLSGSAGTLSFANALALDSGSILSYGLNGTNTTSGGGINDLAAVAGNLSLDGTLNVSEIGLGSFLTATQGDTWRLFTYSGTLTDNGLSLGAVPTLSSGLTLAVDTSTANEVNLIVVPEPAVAVSAMAGIGLLTLLQARLTRKKSLTIRDRC